MSLTSAPLRAFEALQFDSQTHCLVEVAGSLRFADARLELDAETLLFTALHTDDRCDDFVARDFSILVQHGLRQQVLVGLLQSSIDFIEAHAAARILDSE